MSDSQLKMRGKKLIALGLDGVPYSFLVQLMAEGHVPFLKSLADSGCFGCMESTKFPLSAVAWSSAYTGMNPAQIGACGFVRKRRNSYLWEYVNPSENAGEDIWHILGSQGYRSVLIGPLFYEVPPDFAGTYIGGEEAGNQDNPYTAEEVGEESVSELVVSMRAKFALASRSLKEEEWDFAFIGFLEPDTMHAWYHCNQYDRLVEGYNAFDKELRDFLEGLDYPDEVPIILISDHGNKPYDKAFHVNSWLYAHDYLRLLPWKKRLWTRMREMVSGIGKVVAQSESPFSMPFYAALYAARTVVRSLPAFRRLILRFRPDLQLPPQAKPKLDRDQAELTINPGVLFDYPRTVAYASLNHGGNLGGIFLNRKECEPSGVVGADEYESVRSEIAAKLLASREAGTGTALVNRVWFREEVYHGPFIEDFPDIVFETEDTYFTYISEDDISRRNVTFDFKNCQHEMDGVVICSGPGFGTSQGLRCHLWDAAPTILDALGADIPPMDGRVISEFLDADRSVRAGDA